MPKANKTASNPAPGAFRRSLRPRTSDNYVVNIDAPRISQDTFFSIPELLHLLAEYLTQNDLKAAIRVSRVWNTIWVPYLYETLFFRKYRRTRNYPKMHSYGHHVKSLELISVKWNNLDFLLNFTASLHSLFLRNTKLSTLQLQDLAEIAPQLRVLHITLGQRSPKPLECQMTPVSAFKHLEDFYWSALTDVRIDDILFVLKSCSHLKSLALTINTLVEELDEAKVEEIDGFKNSSLIVDVVPELVKVDDAGWASTSLRALSWGNVMLGPRQSCLDDSKQPHPCIRRLFLHTPNLRKVKISGKNNIGAQDWDCMFENQASIQEIELALRFLVFEGGSRVGDSGFLNAVSKSCPNLKKFTAKHISPTTDEAFAGVMRVNHGLQKVSVKCTEFADLALHQLARLPQILTSAGASHSLVELDVEGCLQITSRSAIEIFENCPLLRNLNLLGTRAGTIELFKGCKSWPCAKVLERLRMDIQPLDYQPRPRNAGWMLPGQVEVPSLNPYAPVEQELIRERLYSLTSLLGLELKGDAMTYEILEDFSFAPKLQKAILCVPYKSNDYRMNREAREMALERGKALFPNWIVWGGVSYASSRLTSMITANVSRDTFVF
ncbi:hypothetical protein BC939DRAFT_493631 [Gamsiella multidivaricata]|uniref:uncharacterized protein n=1 Tax=Gamsiella multidivaricata TaxID=101098 RepID=UPI0022210E94|nr:uncharacterized protein BC939DRAFT_493631 [Gamsiella multidivaricata]KAG0353046.1 hypothetical protein BGZ54_002427 [Gamsiella multidivaricata]KAI7822371.1 hypothetical protein BC939DRAFT_493631 [Gamsiella multidivaricata]